MRLLVVRHAIAGTREEWARTGKPDTLRPVTAEGRRKMRRAARGLARIVRAPDLLATSPLARAAQTAEIVADGFGIGPAEATDVLAPSASRQALLAWLRERHDRELVAIVGHEPNLGQAVSWLVAARAEGVITLRKGGACLLEFGDEIAAGKGTLRWALTPAQLRRLA